MGNILEAENLCVSYGKKQVLENLNMMIPKGSIYGLVGKNGAGKSTLIMTVCGLINPCGGSYSLFGISNQSKEIIRMRRRIGAVAETPSLYPDFTVYENMQLQYRLLGLPSEKEIREQLCLMKIDDLHNEKVKNLSLGMKQRLGIVMTLAGNPDFIILDEPTNGLDPQGMVDLRELLLDINSRMDTTILISSHILETIQKVATCYGFLGNRRILTEITADDLNKQCRECLWVRVSDTKKLVPAMDELNVDYSISTDTEALLYTDRFVGELALALNRHGCMLERVEDRKETLESFYLNVIGGDDCE